jgi:hypothetical protein
METKEHEVQRPSIDRRPTEEHRVELSLDRRRLLQLAEAIRAHEARVSAQVASPRPHDLELYRRLRQIGGAA